MLVYDGWKSQYKMTGLYDPDVFKFNEDENNN